MERIREFWHEWWKLIGIFVLIGASVWFVYDCNRGERSRFLDCLDSSISSGQTLYYGNDAYYDQVSKYDAIEAAKTCYDDRTQGDYG